MFHIITEEDRKNRTWEEICGDFPECHVALEKPHDTTTMCTGGVVVAYSMSGDNDSADGVCIYALDNGYTYTQTHVEGGITQLV